MDGDELDEWKIYFSKNPFTQDLLDVALAQLCLVMARTMGGDKKSKVSDFTLINRGKKKMQQQFRKIKE